MASMDLIKTVTTLESNVTYAGKITRLGEGKFLWVIDDILSILLMSCTLSSPHTDGVSLQFDVGTKYVKVSCQCNSSPRLLITLGMKTGCKGGVETHCGKINQYGIFQVRCWMTYNEFMNRRAEILKNGSLTVFCTVKRVDTEDTRAAALSEPLLNDKSADEGENDIDEEKMAIQQWKTVKKMQEDLKSMLSKGEDSDVTLKVQEKEFRAHRNILKARSAVFKSMFNHDTAESQTKEVTIEDCDPKTFPDFLTYMYTGSTEHLSAANVCSLYTAADKYCMDALKEECSAFMKNNLSVDSFSDFIALALLHEEEELIELATAFFREHMLAIIKTAKWETFLHENTKVGNELLIKAASK